MGCGVSADLARTTATPAEEAPRERRRWVCQKCTLDNTEVNAACAACGSPPPALGALGTLAAESDGRSTASPGGRSNVRSPSGDSRGSSEGLPTTAVLWCPGDEAEAQVDGVWVDCTIVATRKTRIDVDIDGLIWARDACDVRRARLAECCVCLDPLCAKQLGAFVMEFGSRSCRHYVHYSCAAAMSTKACPICRSEFAHIVQVPRADRHPREWFRVINYESTGHATPDELRAALSGFVPRAEDDLWAIIKQKWSTWDPRNAGHVSPDLAEPIVTHFLGLHAAI
ncbi:hypothetical protein DIPPA_20142 [Diplonema papillatum]|nr:hypothetical protein DIPPA_20142 [Diplonema papillatum]